MSGFVCVRLYYCLLHRSPCNRSALTPMCLCVCQRLLSVQRMMMFAGHTVLVSGTTLFVCFCTCLFFPITMLISIGLGSVIAVTSTMVVNLTFTPAALLCFHGFFSHSQCLGCACCCCRHCKAPCDKQSGGASKVSTTYL